MVKTALDILISGFADLARGCKKIKTALTEFRDTPQHAGGSEIPEISQCLALLTQRDQNDVTPQDVGGSEIPEISQSPEPEKFPWATFEAEKFLLLKSCIWGPNFIKSFLQQCVGEYLRADKFGNHWICDHSLVRGWRCINDDLYNHIMNECQKNLFICHDIIKEYDTYEKFVCNVGVIRLSRFNRRSDIEESSLTNSDFAKYCRNVHKGMDPLRSCRKV